MSASLGAQAKSVEVLFDGKADCIVRGLCFVERVGAVLLLEVPIDKCDLQLHASDCQVYSEFEDISLLTLSSLWQTEKTEWL
jgi:hypothetical protein